MIRVGDTVEIVGPKQNLTNLNFVKQWIGKKARVVEINKRTGRERYGLDLPNGPNTPVTYWSEDSLKLVNDPLQSRIDYWNSL